MAVAENWTRKNNPSASSMELVNVLGTPLSVSRVAIATWAIGGWMWGGTDEAESIFTIRTALAHGINVVDTAPVYGFGRSEEIVGRAIADGLRSQVILATKVGLEWLGRKHHPQWESRAHHARNRRLVAPSAHPLHRRLSSPLAGPEGSHGGDGQGD